MKILKIRVSGFKLLEDNFEIDFLSKARVGANDKEDEIIEYYNNLYIPTTIVFTGKNASGKSSVLSLLTFVNELLNEGRIRFNVLDFRDDLMHLDLFFALDNKIYNYKTDIIKPETKLLDKANYCSFRNERLLDKKYSKTYGKNILNNDFNKVTLYKSDVGDTSLLYKLVARKSLFINSNNWFHDTSIESIFKLFEMFDVNENLMIKIARLFDDSIDKFTYDKNKRLYTLSLKGLGKKNYSESEMRILLSDGTIKGMTMFGLIIAVLKTGGSLMIDEIENSFHKNLVENIIMIFNDKRINKNKANLLFSTHYVEILDIFRRRDNIFITSKKDGYITNCNLYEDYDERIELSKSNQFNNNTFGTLINYDQLMALKKELINEIPGFNRG